MTWFSGKMGNTNNVFKEVYGLVQSKNGSIIEVAQEVSDTRLRIDISTVMCDWELYTGDAVLLHMVNEKVSKIEQPESIEYVEGEIREINKHCGIINENIIFFAETFKTFSEFVQGDKVKCSIIRGYYQNNEGKSFEKRCISLLTNRLLANGSNKSTENTIAPAINDLSFLSKLDFKTMTQRPRIEYYNIPNGLVEMIKSKNLNRVNEKLDEFLSDGPLTMGNYAQRLHGLLHLDEAEMKIGFERYKMDKILLPQGNSRFILPHTNTQELRPQIQAGDFVSVCELAGAERTFRGKVETVNPNNFVLRIGDKFEENLSAAGYSICFNYNRSAFRRKHTAIDLFVAQFKENLLFPTELCPNPSYNRTIDVTRGQLYVDGSKVDWFQDHLNDQQTTAVKSALHAVCNLPFIIYGPPGTGKTSTLVEIILQIHAHWPDARVLVTTQTNSAANIVATRLIKSCASITSALIRVVSSSSAKKYCLPDELKPFSRLVNRYQEPDDADNNTNQKEIPNCDVNELDGYKIFITTCVGAGVMQNTRLSKDFFTHVICDEASQCTEPDTLIPITYLNQTTGRIIMAGDPNQLPPVVISRFAAARGLKQSLFERLYERYKALFDIEVSI